MPASAETALEHCCSVHASPHPSLLSRRGRECRLLPAAATPLSCCCWNCCLFFFGWARQDDRVKMLVLCFVSPHPSLVIRRGRSASCLLLILCNTAAGLLLASSVAGLLCCCCPLLLLLALGLVLVLDLWMSESIEQEVRESPPPLVEVNQAN